MIIQAELKCKQAGCEAEPCAVDKVIELPSPRFKQFSRTLLADYDFIAENKDAIQRDEDARHCLLILDAEGTDGFLVDPQGYNYARYSAFVPNARSLLTPDMEINRGYLSPTEPWRNENRDEMLRMTLRVEGKLDYTLFLPADEEYLDAVKAYGWLSSETMTIDYGTHGMPDIGANQMYYSATESGTIDTMPDIPGLAVWHDGHIGVYIGGGQVIEAMGTKYGVVKTELAGRGWTHWLKIPYINYD